MQAKRSELTVLIVALGGTEKIVRKLDRRKFLFRVGNIPKLETEPDFKAPDGDLGKLDILFGYLFGFGDSFLGGVENLGVIGDAVDVKVEVAEGFSID